MLFSWFSYTRISYLENAAMPAIFNADLYHIVTYFTEILTHWQCRFIMQIAGISLTVETWKQRNAIECPFYLCLHLICCYLFVICSFTCTCSSTECNKRTYPHNYCRPSPLSHYTDGSQILTDRVYLTSKCSFRVDPGLLEIR